MHIFRSTDIKGIATGSLMTIFARLSRSEVLHGRAAMFIVAIFVVTNNLIR